ncbi:MAG: hypothetical protein KJO43_13365, partial [Phycisphaerae bacterium]|nr:hypothetical protein [Phycisphaerae bacterium]
MTRSGLLLFTLLAASGCAPLGRTHAEATLRVTGDYIWVEDLDVPPVTGVAGCGAQALAAALTIGAGPDAATTLAETLPW